MCNLEPVGRCAIRLKNDPLTFVDDAMTGTVMLNKEIAMIEKSRIIVRRDHMTEAMDGKVKLLAGSGSGHEPAFSSYVGRGLLTASIQGGIFQPPSTLDVCTAVREIGTGHKPGVLLIINNTSAERLTFGVALEKAKAEKIKAKLLVVTDDCFQPKAKSTGRRGTAGVIFIIKIAGAMAEKDEPLEAIYAYCHRIVVDLMFTCVTSLTIPAPNRDRCVCIENPNHQPAMLAEFGVGLHGEQGIQKANIKTTSDLVKFMLKNISEAFDAREAFDLMSADETEEIPEKLNVAVLVNNLGYSTPMEEKIVAGETIQQLKELGYTIERTYAGMFITALDLRGFSITVMQEHDETMIEYLDFPTSAPAWQHTCPIDLSSDELSLKIESCLEISDEEVVPVVGPKISHLTASVMPVLLTFICDALISCERQLNIMDGQTSDGDAGTNIRRGVEALKLVIGGGKLDCYHPAVTLKSMSEVLDVNMPGTLGALYNICLEVAGQVFLEKPETYTLSSIDWMEALAAAIEAIKQYGCVSVGDGTMLDSFAQIYEAVMSLPKDVQLANQLHVMKIAAEAAEAASQRTANPGRGEPFQDRRASSSQVRSLRSSMHPDPGVHAISIWMRAAYEAMKLKNPGI